MSCNWIGTAVKILCCTPFRPLVWTTAVLAILTGCSGRILKKTAVATNPASHHRDYIDLQAGWRLRVVTPLGKAGDYRLTFKEKETSGNMVTMATDDFKGYEVAYYAVESRSGGGVKIRFLSAELIQAGKSAPLSQSVLPLFVLPRRSRFVRLVYLTRAGDIDHQMAVIASQRPGDADALTRAVQANPKEGCDKRGDHHCAWIPLGVAVRPELERAADGVWIPVR